MLFQACPGYVVPSESTVGRMVDKEFNEMVKYLNAEISTAVNQSFHKTIHVTYDHVTSSDRFHTKKLGVSLHYVTKQLVMKSETIVAMKCVGKQSWVVNRDKVKKLLEMHSGWSSDWKICVITDRAKNVVSLRSTNRHNEVGLTISYEASCVDHLLHLVIEDTIGLKSYQGVKASFA